MAQRATKSVEFKRNTLRATYHTPNLDVIEIYTCAVECDISYHGKIILETKTLWPRVVKQHKSSADVSSETNEENIMIYTIKECRYERIHSSSLDLSLSDFNVILD